VHRDAYERTPPSTRFHAFSALAVFRDVVTPEAIVAHTRTLSIQRCRAGYVFYTPGQPGDLLFILTQGAAHIYRMSQTGRKLVIARLPPMSIFGEMGCIGQGMYDTYAEAIEDSVICSMGRRDVERLVLAHPRLGLRLLDLVGQRLLAVEQRLEDAAFKGLIPRLAGLLVREARGDEIVGWSHQDIADHLGIHRETVTNGLNELKAAGAIAIGRRRLVVCDRRRLERAAAE
jgi:CRP-like cAMP-binding protein